MSSTWDCELFNSGTGKGPMANNLVGYIPLVHCISARPIGPAPTVNRRLERRSPRSACRDPRTTARYLGRTGRSSESPACYLGCACRSSELPTGSPGLRAPVPPGIRSLKSRGPYAVPPSSAYRYSDCQSESRSTRTSGSIPGVRTVDAQFTVTSPLVF